MDETIVVAAIADFVIVMVFWVVIFNIIIKVKVVCIVIEFFKAVITRAIVETVLFVIVESVTVVVTIVVRTEVVHGEGMVMNLGR